MKIFYQKRFSEDVRNRIKKERFETYNPNNKEHVMRRMNGEWVEGDNLKRLTRADITYLIDIIFDEISKKLFSGSQVVFEGWISFFTRPVKRNSYDSKKNNTRKTTYAKRMRFRPLERLKSQAEKHLTEEEYKKITKKE